MDLFQAIILAIIQGITEFLPISSSAHLILPKEILGWQDQGLAFDVAVHLGTLLAVIYAFRKKIADLVVNFFKWLGFKEYDKKQQKLVWNLVIATLPAGILGLLLADFIEANLRSALVIASATLVFGFVLWIADRRKNLPKDLYSISFSIALIIGLAQALALIPGTSRSGITISAALLLGIGRKDSAEFSFLLSIPIILAAGLLEGLKLYKLGINMEYSLLLLAVFLAFATAYLSIKYFLKWIEKLGLMPFVIYRIALGTFLLVYLAF